MEYWPTGRSYNLILSYLWKTWVTTSITVPTAASKIKTELDEVKSSFSFHIQVIVKCQNIPTINYKNEVTTNMNFKIYLLELQYVYLGKPYTEVPWTLEY